MDTSPLAQSPIGMLVPISGHDPRRQIDFNALAYLPYALPETLSLSAQTYRAITKAMSSIARADQAMRQLPNPELLTRLVIRKEAVSTSAIEGTYCNMEELLQADFEEAADVKPAVAEVQNYVTAAEDAADWIKRKRPISVGLLEHLQGTLVAGTESDTVQAGSVRTTQVFIHVSDGKIENARFIPCPPGLQLKDGMLAWEGWVNQADEEIPLLARLAMGHYQFETLHPFNDGNGRLGRMVMLLQLLAAGELQLPSIALSPWLEANRNRYTEHLFRVSVTGDFEPWIQFICDGIAAQAVSAVKRVEDLVTIRDAMLSNLHETKAKGTSLEIARELIGYPMLTARAMETRHGVSYQAANLAIRKLVELGFLRQFSEGNYGRIFICDEVFKVLIRPL